MISTLFERNLKSKIAGILIRGDSKTAKQLFYDLKKKGTSVTTRGIFKALSELLQDKVIIKYQTIYEINPEWISQLEKNSRQALIKLLESKPIGIEAENLQQMCDCQRGHTEGFCSICQ